MPPRVLVGLAVAALGAAFGGLLLGEYDFTGSLPWFAGPIMGVVLAELAAEIGGRRSPLVGLVTGALAAGGLLWAAWISSGEGLRPMPTAVWPSMLLTLAAAVLWVGLPSRGGRRSPE